MSSNWKLLNTGAGFGPAANWSASTSATESTSALNTAFTFGTGGVCFATWFFCPESGNLTDFFLKVKTYTGSWAATDGVVNVQIREGTNNNNIPGSTLVSSFTVAFDGITTGWFKTTGLSIAITAGKFYSIVVGDADGGGTNFVTITRSYQQGANLSAFLNSVTTSTNGFSSAGSSGGAAAGMAMKVAGNIYGGSSYDTVATITNGTYERGHRFQPPENCTLVGIVANLDMGNFLSGTINLYADATAPGGTALMTFTFPGFNTGGATSPQPSCFLLPAAKNFDLVGGTWYRLVYKPASNSTTPRKISMRETNGFTDLIAALLPMNGNYYFTNDNSGSWLDDTISVCMMGPVLVPRSSAASVEPSTPFVG